LYNSDLCRRKDDINVICELLAVKHGDMSYRRPFMKFKETKTVLILRLLVEISIETMTIRITASLPNLFRAAAR